MTHIAMLTVKPMKGNSDLGNAVGATVNVLLLTENFETYKQEVVARMNDFGYEVIEIEDVEIFDPADKCGSKDLRKKAKLLTSENPLLWGTFYTFESWDDQ